MGLQVLLSFVPHFLCTIVGFRGALGLAPERSDSYKGRLRAQNKGCVGGDLCVCIYIYVCVYVCVYVYGCMCM